MCSWERWATTQASVDVPVLARTSTLESPRVAPLRQSRWPPLRRVPPSDREVCRHDKSDELHQRESQSGVEEQRAVFRNHIRVEIRTLDCEVQGEAEDKRCRHRHRKDGSANRAVPSPRQPNRRPRRDRDDKHDEQNLQRRVFHSGDGVSVLVDPANSEMKRGDNDEGRSIRPRTHRRCTRASFPRFDLECKEGREGARRETATESSRTPRGWRRHRCRPGVSLRRRPRFHLPGPRPGANDPFSPQLPETSRAVRCVLLAARSPGSSDCDRGRLSFCAKESSARRVSAYTVTTRAPWNHPVDGLAADDDHELLRPRLPEEIAGGQSKDGRNDVRDG